MIHLTQFLDPIFLVKTLGLIGIFFIIYAESGLLIGFFLPGDSILFTAGLFASENHFSLWFLLLGAFLCAVLGDNTGYWFGKKIGPKIFTREDSLFFHKDHLLRSKKFYEKYGKKAIILSRFVPIVRTFAPILAGVGEMSYANFVFFNIAGGFLWSVGLILAGYFLGTIIPNVDAYIVPIVIAIIILSFVPFIMEIIRGKKGQS
jgi:membrane-associated protein